MHASRKSLVRRIARTRIEAVVLQMIRNGDPRNNGFARDIDLEFEQDSDIDDALFTLCSREIIRYSHTLRGYVVRGDLADLATRDDDVAKINNSKSGTTKTIRRWNAKDAMIEKLGLNI